MQQEERKHIIHQISRIILSFSFFATMILFGAVMASNGLSTSWIPQQVLVFFGWILVICSILGMIFFILDKEQ